jgi:hypothetical protein
VTASAIGLLKERAPRRRYVRLRERASGRSLCGVVSSLPFAPHAMRALLCAIASVLALPAGSVAAQVPFSACLDRELRSIPGRVDNSMAAGAVATVEDGHPIILWNQHNLGQASSTYQLFVYLHECAHHNLNHVYKLEGRSIEDQADCWAYQLLVDGGMLNGSHVDQLTREFRRSPGDINHLGGEALLAWLDQCLALRLSKPDWFRALDTLSAAAPTGFASLRGPPVRTSGTGSFEVAVGTPGTFDCELIQPPAIRCMVFVTRKEKVAQKRFAMLQAIILQWLPTHWAAIQTPAADGALTKSLAVRDTIAGTLLLLGLTPQNRIYFMIRAPGGTAGAS